MSQARQAVAAAKRIVVKVGSSSLTTAVGGLDPSRLDALVDALAARSAAGSQVVLVSSGAIAAGLAPLGIGKRPKDLATQQAAASVGQLELVHAYATSFARYSLTVGQLLLTADDVVRRSHYRNAQRTFSRLLALGVVPVVNENDTVATDEIRFGDNDRLAALVAHLVGADALVLLSDVDALYTGDPRRSDARRITEVVDESDLADVIAGTTGASGVGTGGMASKLAAARLASSAGIPVLLASSADAASALAATPAGVPSPPPAASASIAPAPATPSAGALSAVAPASADAASPLVPASSGIASGVTAASVDAASDLPAASSGTPSADVSASAGDASVPALIAGGPVSAGAPAAVGTAFAATGSRLSARRFWLAHAADSAGRLTLDDGAVTAVVTRRRSLLAAGIAGVHGDFDAGDVVDLTDLAGKVVARGVVAFDAVELPAMIGRSTHHLAPEQRREVVHADDLVPLPHPN
ncbi:glutamate 5-kinase [Kutzneria sp. NPDC051319]|uniref:glutamate 5-kinase n=1 Tax=Kutzneria sp. NPDC051319 TaxID=3155047 RepID=UPI00342E02BB